MRDVDNSIIKWEWFSIDISLLIRNIVLILIDLWIVYLSFYLYYDMFNEIFRILPEETRWSISLLALSIVGLNFIFLLRSPKLVIVLSLATTAIIGSILYFLGGIRTGYEPYRDIKYWIISISYILSIFISLIYILFSKKIGFEIRFILGLISQIIICLEAYKIYNSLSKIYQFVSSASSTYYKNPVQKFCENPMLPVGLAFLIVVASPYLLPIVGIILNLFGLISWITGFIIVGREENTPKILLTLIYMAETFNDF